MTFRSSPNRFLAALIGLAIPTLLLGSPADGAFTDHTYTAGHSDIGVEYTGGTSFRLFYDFGGDAVIDGILNGGTGEGTGRIPDLDASNATVLLSSASRVTAPAGGIPFLSTPAGGSAYIISQTNQPGLPFLGFGVTEELEPEDWSTPISFQLSGYSSSTGGQFAVWQASPFGSLISYMQTNDGISSSDVVTKPAGVHDHFNLGFSQAGIYDVTLTATGTRTDGTVVTGTGTFHFNVGPLADPPSGGTVPEPSSLALLGIGMVSSGLAWGRRRRKAGMA